MNETHTTRTKREKKSEPIVAVENAVENAVEGAMDQVHTTVEGVQDKLVDIRESASILLRDKPYVVAAAAGAVGLALGLTLGSKLLRLLAVTAVGAVLSDQFGDAVSSRIRTAVTDFTDELKGNADERDAALD